MNCKQARRLITLAARGDIPSPCGLPQHLELCPDCAAFRDALQDSLQVLQRFGEQTAAELDAEHDPSRSRELVEQTLKSLWRRGGWNRPVFNAWVPLSVAVAVAFGTVLLIPWLAPDETPIRIDTTADLDALSGRFERVSIDPSWERISSVQPSSGARESAPVRPGAAFSPWGPSADWIQDVSQRNSPSVPRRPASLLLVPPDARSFVRPVRQQHTDFSDF